MADYIDSAVAALNAEIADRAAAADETEQTQSSSEEDALFEALFAGREITRDMAMTIPKVSACVNRISDAIAMTPFRLYRRFEEGGRVKIEELTKDDRVRIVNIDTGDTLTGFEFKKALATDFLLGGGGYAYINRMGNSIVSLHYVSDRIVSVTRSSDPIFKSYVVQINGRMFDEWQIFRALRSTKDGATGRSLIKEISKAIETAYSALLYELHVTTTGGVKKGFLQAQGSLAPDVKKEIKEGWRKLYSSDSKENILLLSNGVTFQEANQTPLDLQLAKIRTDMNREIQEAFGLEDDDKKFLKRTLKPIMTAFENAMAAFLLLEKEKATHYWKADTRQLEDVHGTAVMSINEARYRENLPTVPGLDIIPLSLGTTIVDAETGKIMVPNTGQTFNLDGSQSDDANGGTGKGGDE